MPRGVLALLLALVAVPAFAQTPDSDRITDFRVDVAIGSDGALTETETIAIHVVGTLVKHGIWRDFVSRTADAGDIEFRRVTLDGADAPYALTHQAGTAHLRIGDPDKRVAPGGHVYAISYVARKQLVDHDGLTLALNVSGTWTMPVDRTSMTVHLPAGSAVQDAGAIVEGGENPGTTIPAEHSDDGTLHFSDAAPLETGESLVVSIHFTNDAIHAGPLPEHSPP